MIEKLGEAIIVYVISIVGFGIILLLLFYKNDKIIANQTAYIKILEKALKSKDKSHFLDCDEIRYITDYLNKLKKVNDK